jgi:cytochrome c oxidase subunit 2
MNWLEFGAFPLWLNVTILICAAVLIWLAGTRLADYADVFSERTHLSEAFLGLVLLGVATSLPEVATSLTASLIGNAQLVSGNLFGGVALQIAVLAIVDLIAVRGALTYFTPHPVLLFQGASVCAKNPKRLVLYMACVSTVLSITGCGGVQSALDPAGREAERMSNMFWLMTAGAIVIWLAVIVLALWAVRTPPESNTRRRSRLIIVGGGAVFPTVVLTALLIYGLKPIPALLAPAPEGSLKINVTGEQWWWRVRYLPPNGPEVVLANEIRLPVGEPVEFRLDSPDVIHSFWIPSLGGKVDMIPGRVNRLVLHPTRTGVFRGACAEYCGTSHALMAFNVVVQERADFDRWLTEQAAPAQPVNEPNAMRGQELFRANGCGACHTIRGTAPAGVIGPDLTHVGSRLSLAAGSLENGPASYQRWIGHTTDVKPGVLMPPFHMLPSDELQAIAAYLDSLK